MSPASSRARPISAAVLPAGTAERTASAFHGDAAGIMSGMITMPPSSTVTPVRPRPYASRRHTSAATIFPVSRTGHCGMRRCQPNPVSGRSIARPPCDRLYLRAPDLANALKKPLSALIAGVDLLPSPAHPLGLFVVCHRRHGLLPLRVGVDPEEPGTLLA